jgi:predicted small secreted protein
MREVCTPAFGLSMRLAVRIGQSHRAGARGTAGFRAAAGTSFSTYRYGFCVQRDAEWGITMASMKTQYLRTLLGLAAMSGLLLSLAACNTTEGLGRDVSATGKAMSNTAEKAKP